MRAHVFSLVLQWVTIEMIEHDSPVGPGARMSFELTSKQGAILITNHSTCREDAGRDHNFATYTKEHYRSWVAFAREKGHGEDVGPIIVTGVDLTKEFATFAYSDNGTQRECQFSAAVPAIGSASLSAWGSWHAPDWVHTNCGPTHDHTQTIQGARVIQGTDETAGLESTIPRDHNQCVFIRYHKFFTMLPPLSVLKAQAGPHQLPVGDFEKDDPQAAMVEISNSNDDLAQFDSDVVHDVPLVSPEHHPRLPSRIKLIQDDRDGFDVVAEFMFRVRAT